MRIRRCLIAAALTAAPLALSAQRPAPTASEIKAAYLYQFGRYVEWPPAPDDFTVCVAGDDAVATALERIAREDAGTSKIVVRRGASAAEATACRILFIGHDEPRRADLLRTLDGKPTLAVGDDAAFLGGGGMIAFIPEDRRIRFSVNLVAAQAAHLRVSSQLLKLAVKVIR